MFSRMSAGPEIRPPQSLLRTDPTVIPVGLTMGDVQAGR